MKHLPGIVFFPSSVRVTLFMIWSLGPTLGHLAILLLLGDLERKLVPESTSPSAKQIPSYLTAGHGDMTAPGNPFDRNIRCSYVSTPSYSLTGDVEREKGLLSSCIIIFLLFLVCFLTLADHLIVEQFPLDFVLPERVLCER